MDIERELNARESRRFAREDRFLAAQERAESKAANLIGELWRQDHTVYYVNLKNSKGEFTGKTKESTSHTELVEYLRRNKYI